jgi:hypothetical protein
VALTEDDITNMSGYRRTFQTVVNYQQVTPHAIEFPASESKVFAYADVPFSVGAADQRILKVNFSGWVSNPRIVIRSSLAGTTAIYNYGQSAQLTLNGVGLVKRLEVWGYLGTEPGQSVEFAEDITSQARFEVIREGSPIDASLLRSPTQALAVAQSIVARSAYPRTRPQVAFRNRFDKTLSYGIGDVVAQSVAEFDLVARRYEIVGQRGAVNEGGKWWDFGWTYLETPYQATLDLFTLNVSTLNSTDILGF